MKVKENCFKMFCEIKKRTTGGFKNLGKGIFAILPFPTWVEFVNISESF
jgi:hypothetical protein